MRRDAVWLCAALALTAACDDGAHLGPREERTIRGRVTDVDGAPLADLDVMADGVRARTDARGRFTLSVAQAVELNVSVESARYSTARMPVTVGSGGADVEIAVKERKVVRLRDAAEGGAVTGDDGFAIELPKGALREANGDPVSGEVEVRYALVREPRDVTATPGRMQTMEGAAIEGYAFAEVRFYQGEKRLSLGEPAIVELPLVSGHGLRDGAAVSAYDLDEAPRWKRAESASVSGDKVRIQSTRSAWIGAAFESPVTSCVSGRLNADAEALSQGTVRAARARGLSLVQADTDDDGHFCMPVSPDDDWDVSAFFARSAGAYRLAVSLDSSNAQGMCGGAGCKDLGDVRVPSLD